MGSFYLAAILRNLRKKKSALFLPATISRLRYFHVYVGCDSEGRLKDTQFKVEGVPTSLRSARNMARNYPFRFEKWAVHRIPGFVTNNKQTGDGGVDGWAGLSHTPKGEGGLCIAQVKGGAPNVDSLKALLSQINRGYASLGVFITLEKWDTPTVRKRIADAGTLQQGTNEFNRLVM